MKLKLRIMRDEEIIFEMPLSVTDWPKTQLKNELDSFEGGFEKLTDIFTALSSETRLSMMRQLLEKEDRTVNFTEFMRDLDLNPKLVRDNARKLSQGGMLEKTGRGRYHCSEFGESSFIVAGLALRRLIEALEG